MNSFLLISIAALSGFLSGFLYARFLYIRNFNKKISTYRRINLSLKEKYLSVFKRNQILEARVRQLQPNLISLDAIFEKIVVSKN